MKLAVLTADASKELLGHADPQHPLLGCEEAKGYLIRRPDSHSRLYADDALLSFDDTGEYWAWQPGFFSGEITLELESPDRVQPIRYVVDVGPSKHKTGREQFNEYLQEIVDYRPQLIAGAEPGKQGLAGRSGFAFIWLRYARLRQFLDRYLQGLQAVCDRPIIRQKSRREQMPLHMARNVDGTTVQRLTSNPGLLAALSCESLPDGVVGPEEFSLDVPFHEPSMDNPANRLMARQLGEVRRLTRGLLAEVTQLPNQVSETKTDLSARLPRRISFLRSVDNLLGRFARQDPFVSATLDKRGAAEFNAVSGNPHYNMAHQTGIRILRQGLSEIASDEQHYIAPTWEIYEAWCFVAIAEALESSFPHFDWQLASTVSSADLVLQGQAVDKRLRLYYQMACPSLERPNRYGYYSISRERRPDLVLELSDCDGSRFICMDSKYTASRPGILDSMASAHVYRDSLRCGTVAASLSILLVPANQEVPVLCSDDYWNNYSVGCAVLSNRGDVPALLDRAMDWLNGATGI